MLPNYCLLTCGLCPTGMGEESISEVGEPTGWGFQICEVAFWTKIVSM
jgi:hypothetical protein